MLNRKGMFVKQYVVKYGFSDEIPQYKTFATSKAAFNFASNVFACLIDVRIEYTQFESIMNEYKESLWLKHYD